MQRGKRACASNSTGGQHLTCYAARLNCVQHALDASAAGPVIVLPPLAQRFEKQVDGRAHPQKSEAVVVDDVIVVAAAAAAAAVEA